MVSWKQITGGNPIMATERINDLLAFKGFIEKKLANGGTNLTLDESLIHWELENQTDDEREETLLGDSSWPRRYVRRANRRCFRVCRADASETSVLGQTMSFRVKLSANAAADFDQRLIADEA
jgi:hypothetical protein